MTSTNSALFFFWYYKKKSDEVFHCFLEIDIQSYDDLFIINIPYQFWLVISKL